MFLGCPLSRCSRFWLVRLLVVVSTEQVQYLPGVSVYGNSSTATAIATTTTKCDIGHIERASAVVYRTDWNDLG